MATYATLDQILPQMTDDVKRVNDPEYYPPERQAQIMQFAELATARIKRDCGYSFLPERYTWKLLPVQFSWFYSAEYRALKPPDPLLEIISVNEGGVSHAGSNYIPFSHAPNYPATYIQKASGGWSLQQVLVDGVWGYRRYYETEGWSSRGTVGNVGGLSPTDTVIDVSQPLGVGMMLKVGDEYMTVTAYNADDNEATVKRGVNGSIAVAHDSGDAITSFNVEPDIVRACAKIVEANLSNIGNNTRVTLTDVGSVVTVFVPEEAQTIIEQYRDKFAVGGI